MSEKSWLLRVLVGYPRLSLLARAYLKSKEDRGHDMAASLAFYCFFSIFPLLVGVIGISLFFVDAEALSAYVRPTLTNAFPGSADFVEQNVEALVRLRGGAGIVGFVGLLWSSSKVFAALSRGINHALGMKAPKNLVYKPIRQMVLAAATSLFLFIAIVGSTTFGLLPVFDDSLAGVIAGHLMSLLLMTGFFVGIYAMVPYHRLSFADVRGPALITALFYETGKTAFVFYLENLSGLQLVYGSLTSVIVMLLWLYMCGRIVLFGGEIVAVRRLESSG